MVKVSAEARKKIEAAGGKITNEVKVSKLLPKKERRAAKAKQFFKKNSQNIS